MSNPISPAMIENISGFEENHFGDPRSEKGGAMGRSVIVVAHPDDEILWLSSVMAQADQVVLCFGAPYGRPDKAENRARAVAHLGVAQLVSLALPESGARLLIDWQTPRLTETGIAITDAAAQQRYDENFPRLLAALRPILAGASDVYTHNPWGEYGHAEHIQVYRAVRTLQAELHFTIWFANYVASQTRSLAESLGRAPLWQEKRSLPTDVKIARRLQKIYQTHKAWTWSRWHKWPATETLYAQPDGAMENGRGLQGEVLYDARFLRLWRPVRAAEWRFS